MFTSCIWKYDLDDLQQCAGVLFAENEIHVVFEQAIVSKVRKM